MHLNPADAFALLLLACMSPVVAAIIWAYRKDTEAERRAEKESEQGG